VVELAEAVLEGRTFGAVVELAEAVLEVDRYCFGCTLSVNVLEVEVVAHVEVEVAFGFVEGAQMFALNHC
jgi:hypothetical protein